MPHRALLLLLLLLVSFPAAASAPREATESVFPLPPLGRGGGMCAQGVQPVNIGYACLEVETGETHASVVVRDPVTGIYGGFYRFILGGGAATPFLTYCDGGFDTEIPDGARILRLAPGRSIQDPDCPGSGTRSDATVTFT
jgi:hypothetical protein